MADWHRFECTYIATEGSVKMRITDWIDTGGTFITKSAVGHFWQVRGYEITEQEWHEVDIVPGELKAKIVFLPEGT